MTNLVILTGGLGNQLFQLNAALSLSKTSMLLVETGLIGTRLVHTEEQPIQEFNWPENVIFCRTRKFERTSKRIIQYLLSRTGDKRGWKNARISKIPLGLIAVYFYLLYGKFFRIVVGDGVGYTDLENAKSEFLMVGYFQSFKYINNSALPELKNESSGTSGAKELLSSVLFYKPIIVHVRLGDYLQEPDIGVLSPSYFIHAVKILKSQGLGKNPVWVISDDLNLARKYLSELSPEGCYWIDTTNLSPAFVIDIFKSAAGYVISNSTFSWWAAHARRNRAASVIAPYPWFMNLKEPEDLIPEGWIRVPSNFQTRNQDAN